MRNDDDNNFLLQYLWHKIIKNKPFVGIAEFEVGKPIKPAGEYGKAMVLSSSTI